MVLSVKMESEIMVIDKSTIEEMIKEPAKEGFTKIHVLRAFG
jgi:hypothetical protein